MTADVNVNLTRSEIDENCNLEDVTNYQDPNLNDDPPSSYLLISGDDALPHNSAQQHLTPPTIGDDDDDDNNNILVDHDILDDQTSNVEADAACSLPNGKQTSVSANVADHPIVEAAYLLVEEEEEKEPQRMGEHDHHPMIDSSTLESQADLLVSVEGRPEQPNVNGHREEASVESTMHARETPESQITGTVVTGSHPITYGDGQEKAEKVQGERRLDMGTDVQESQDSHIMVNEDVQNYLDLDQEKEKEPAPIPVTEDGQVYLDVYQEKEPADVHAAAKDIKNDLNSDPENEPTNETENVQNNLDELADVHVAKDIKNDLNSDLEKEPTNDTENVQNDFNLDQEKESAELANHAPSDGPPKASGGFLEQSLHLHTSPVVADMRMEKIETVDGVASDERREWLAAACPDSVAENGVICNINDANSNPSGKNCSSGKNEIMIAPNPETSKSFSTDNDTVGDIINDDTAMAVVQSEPQVISVHAVCEQNITSGIAVKLSSSVPDDRPVEISESILPAPTMSDAVVDPEVAIRVPHCNDETNIDDGRGTESDVGKLHLDNSEIGLNNGLGKNDRTSSNESKEGVSTYSSAAMCINSEVTKGFSKLAVSKSIDSQDGETCMQNSIENESNLSAFPVDEVESENENTYIRPSKDSPSNDSLVLKVLNGSVVENGGSSTEGVEKAWVEDVDGIHKDETSTCSPECSSVDASDGLNMAAEVVRKPFYYMIKIPRCDDESLKDQIKCAQGQVDEKTRSRDTIRAEIHAKRTKCKEFGDSFNAAISEEKAARELLKAKRKEIDSVQSMINRVKSAISIDEIDGKIRSMEHMIQHETLPLKEEKQFIREIKQLKQLREQFSSNTGSHDELQEAMDQKDQVEERFKFLRKEVDLFRENIQKAEAATKDTKKKYNHENNKLKELLACFRTADDIRQEAYAHLQSLKKQAYEKNREFWKYKDDAKSANDLAVKGDKEELQLRCVNQVERVMELWNNNDEFRKEYIRCNMRSTVRRFRTLDGRSLGPHEVPLVIPNVVSEKVAKENSVLSIPAPEGERTFLPKEMEKKDDRAKVELGNQQNQTAKTKRPAKPAASGTVLANVSGRDEIEKEVRQEKPKHSKEEEEMAREAEELRKEEEAAILKEKQRLEEKAKAKETMERKRRNAERAQARAALRAQKEAEQKEKEREKRTKKKEKKKAAMEETNNMNEEESSAIAETKESGERKEKAVAEAVTKRPERPSQLRKQNRANALPAALRNRGKRRMRAWMWGGVIGLVVFAIYLLVKWI